ncbi:CDP-glucose 4,6-dehydratase [Verrucomicrobium sp. BvORR106]|uniref:CDP-glucose 4,6-dehydratase n=1 Tax=Verrucomicrobium sp. BvORR106 TaxID=1403819 RepID=UPI00056DD7AB|nr:CDP-glucose 4,6-dehydratase [Verrucomicrobium sp. BvORR106]
MVNPFDNIYHGKRVLVTGHTGFKGAWMSLWLHELGAKVSGYSLPPDSPQALYSLLPQDLFQESVLADVRDGSSLKDAITRTRPEIIFHLAAQPIVGLSYKQPLDTFTTNALGTAQLLECVREFKAECAVVVVTSDKCYRNDNSGIPFKENDPLGGSDVYSMSKAATELVVSSWHSSFFKNNAELGALATGRAGNVVGGGDYAEDRIVPDLVRSYVSKEALVLRRPHATRPWQHVLESLSGYLALGQRLLAAPNKDELLSFNFGPDPEAERSVKELVDQWVQEWPSEFSVRTDAQPAYAEAYKLGLDHSLATSRLGWRPVWDFATTVKNTAEWYRLRHEGGASTEMMIAFTRSQIASYAADAASQKIAWAN